MNLQPTDHGFSPLAAASMTVTFDNAPCTKSLFPGTQTGRFPPAAIMMRYDDNQGVFGSFNGRGAEGETAESYFRNISFAGIAAYESPGERSDAYHPTELDSSTTIFCTGMMNIVNTSLKPIKTGDRLYLGFPDIRSMRKNNGLLLASLITTRDISDLEEREFTQLGDTQESIMPDHVRLFQTGILKMVINALSASINEGLVTIKDPHVRRTEFLANLMSRLGISEGAEHEDPRLREQFLSTMLGHVSLFDKDTMGNDIITASNKDLFHSSTAFTDIRTALSSFEREMGKRSVGVALSPALPGSKFDALILPLSK